MQRAMAMERRACDRLDGTMCETHTGSRNSGRPGGSSQRVPVKRVETSDWAVVEEDTGQTGVGPHQCEWSVSQTSHIV